MGVLRPLKVVLENYPEGRVEQLAVVETDTPRARQVARQTLGFFTRIPAYQASFRRQGFADETVAEVGDDFVDAVIACGDGSTIGASGPITEVDGLRNISGSIGTALPCSAA